MASSASSSGSGYQQLLNARRQAIAGKQARHWQRVAEDAASPLGAALSPQAQTQSEALPEVKIIHGGIEISCDLFRAVQFNFFMMLSPDSLLKI